MKILVFGSLNYDLVYSVHHILRPGETGMSKDEERFLGGKGLNQATAIAKAGVPVYLAGCVGTDGAEFIEHCKVNNINTQFINQVTGTSGRAIIQKDENGQNAILVCRGVNYEQTIEHIDSVISYFNAGDILVLQNEISMLDYIVQQGDEKGMHIVLNPSPFNAKLDKINLNQISIFMINEIEGEQITGLKEPEKILKCMKEKYPKSKVVLTLGEKGVMYQDEKGILSQSAYNINVVDTTAAGDTFTGYFLASIVEKMEIQEGLEYATKASAIAVSREGATNSIPNKVEVSQFQ